MEQDSRWHQLERMRENLERLEARLVSIRMAIESAQQREAQWHESARLREDFRARAASRDHKSIALTWEALKVEADEAAELELEQRLQLERRQDELVLTIKCAHSDLDELTQSIDHLASKCC